MKGIRVDPERMRVVAQAGATWHDLDHETQAFGLAVTGGLISSTGIAGFTLGGGIGWLMRKYGLSADNLVAADMVTADGRLVHASEHENAELFWGLRGGGGNFGVVTSFEFELHRVGPTILAGPIFFPGEQAEQILRGYRAYTADLPGRDDDAGQPDHRTAGSVPARGRPRQEDRRRRRRLRRGAGCRTRARRRPARARNTHRGSSRADAVHDPAVVARSALGAGRAQLLQGGLSERRVGRDDRVDGQGPRLDHLADVRDPPPPRGRGGRPRPGATRPPTANAPRRTSPTSSPGGPMRPPTRPRSTGPGVSTRPSSRRRPAGPTSTS